MTKAPDNELYRDIAVKAAMTAGNIILKEIKLVKNISTKVSESDLLTATDLECETAIKAVISKKYPDHLFLGEETSGDRYKLCDSPTWIIDPIDGTANFVQGNPFTCVSIGLAINQEVVVGVVYQPTSRDLYTAINGQGSYLNGVRLATQVEKPLGQCIVNTGFSSGLLRHRHAAEGETRVMLDALDSVIKHNFNVLLYEARDIRRTGASALELCYIADGRYDASFELDNKEWDLAAGSLILTEAGGSILQYNGDPVHLSCRQYVAAGNESLARLLCSKIKHPGVCMIDLSERVQKIHKKNE